MHTESPCRPQTAVNSDNTSVVHNSKKVEAILLTIGEFCDLSSAPVWVNVAKIVSTLNRYSGRAVNQKSNFFACFAGEELADIPNNAQECGL